MQDQLIRGILKQGQARILMASTAQLVEQARLLHQPTPVCTAALGRAADGRLRDGRYA